MAYDKALISSILRQLEQQHDRYEAEAESRRYQLSADIPRLAEIDRELRGTAAKAMRIAFESNNTDTAIEQFGLVSDAHAGDNIRVIKLGDGTCSFTPAQALNEVGQARRNGTL